MPALILTLLAVARVFFRSGRDSAIEILALRQLVAVFKRRRPRPELNFWDRLFRTALRYLWPHWSDVWVIVKPETAVAWHRAGFRRYWRWRSRSRGGQPKIAVKIRTLIRRLAEENTGCGAPRIHAGLQKPGVVVSGRTVARYLRRIRRRGDLAERWLASLENRREGIAAFGFFTVPTRPFNVLYCFFVIAPGRRRILHFNVTRHPAADRLLPQLREAFPETQPYRYVIFDNDTSFDRTVTAFLKAAALEPTRTSIHAPWQNGTPNDGPEAAAGQCSTM